MLFGVAVCLCAQEYDEKVVVHGFGSWSYAKTDGNNYLRRGNEDGNWNNWEFAFNISATVTDKLRLNAQLFTEANRNSENAQVDYVFAEYAFSDALKLRLGKVKHPCGIFGDVLKVGTLRTFMELPTSIYHFGQVSDGYTGIGLVGNLNSGRWGLDYHLYFGTVEAKVSMYNFPVILGNIFMGIPIGSGEPIVFNSNLVENAVGFHLVADTPVDGLSFGGSFSRASTRGKALINL